MGSRTVDRVIKKIMAKAVMGHKAKVPRAAFCESANSVFCDDLNGIKRKIDEPDYGGMIDMLVDFKTGRDMLLGAGCKIKKCPRPKGKKAKS